ncbi:unnamed protein product [Spirodela intermedia]|uniref:DUF7036 domain-containing protein n=1 Tax=Spirodela intermedia TaxID=51605 RepID=A0A7I8I8K6_SPIIN|nr:unnamed protein product [Spirodela intermedia]CAA6653997.1 unnamed protein product [Spirodela intermedia]
MRQHILALSNIRSCYSTLTNSHGSTVSPPTVVQTSILLAVGNHPPSKSRLKELAQSINPARNLGLNHTVFGRVKQIRLSSFLRHSINSSGPCNYSSSPSSAPQPHPTHHHRHHHHHHHHHHSHHHHSHHHSHHHHSHHRHRHHLNDHHHHHPGYLAAPTPSPLYSNAVPPPPSRQFGSSKKPKIGFHIDPAVPPSVVPSSPTPDSNSESSPIPYVIFSRVHPPTESRASPANPSDKMASSCEYSSFFTISIHSFYLS